MMKKTRNVILSLSCMLLTACIGNFFTGANLIYDRHHVYKKAYDIKLSAQAGHAIKLEPTLNCPSNKCFEIAVFHGDVLLLGTVQTEEQKQKASSLVKNLEHLRHLYNFINVNPNANYDINWQDSIITTQVRSQIMANSDIDPAPFKVVSYENVVYLMGDVMEDQEELIKDIARNTKDVTKVVNLLHVYMLKPKK
jgi:osmotically-inducible protein OsmY